MLARVYFTTIRLTAPEIVVHLLPGYRYTPHGDPLAGYFEVYRAELRSKATPISMCLSEDVIQVTYVRHVSRRNSRMCRIRLPCEDHSMNFFEELPKKLRHTGRGS